MRHILSLEVIEVSNEGIFIVKDTSIYTSAIGVACQSLQITPPGFDTPTVVVPSTQNFEIIFNACTLGITPAINCATSCPRIPDGIYSLYYTVSPNTDVYVGYKYLRITSAMNRRNQLLCDLALPCCLPDKELQYELRNLDIIRNYLISAQVNVNNLKDYSTGINEYRYAVDLMDKMSHRKPHCSNVLTQ